MANLLYHVRETPIVFKSTGGDAVFTLTSLGTGAGRQSARFDRGTTAKPDRYIWRARTKAAVAPVVGNVVNLYLGTSDGTDADGELATGDAALPALDRRRNLQWIGSIVCDEASNTRFFTRSGLIEICERWIQPVWVNDLGQALSSTAADHYFTLTPAPPELQ